MVQPINYMLDVVNPMTAAMAGYSAGATDRTNQQVTQQKMQMAAAQEARAAEAFQLEKAAMEEQRRANQAAVAQAAEAKRRGEAAMEIVVEKGIFAEPIDYANAIAANPGMAQDIQARREILGPERTKGETKFGTQLYTMLVKNPDTAKTFLEERRIAAENAGDQETVDTMKAYGMMLEQPEGQDAVRALVGTGLFGIMGKDAFTAFTNELGIGGGKVVEGASPLGKIAQDVEAGLIPKRVLDAAIAVDQIAQSGELTPQNKMAQEQQIRGEWTKQATGVSDARRNYSIIEQSAADDTGAGDIALVTSFLKMLDPLTGVRETEFATAQDSGGLISKLKGFASKIESGKFLTPQQREEYKNLSRAYLKAAEDSLVPTKINYEKVISNYGLNPENIFVVGGALAGETTQSAEGAAPTAGPPVPGEGETAPPAADGTVPQSFLTSNDAKAVADRYGVTMEEMWAFMKPEDRAKYGR
jgi:hypothetical protein